MSSINDAQMLAVREGWITEPVIPCLYVSAGTDTHPFALLHPTFLARQGAGHLEAPNFLVYIDSGTPRPDQDPSLSFEDDRTRIETLSHRTVDLAGYRAELLHVSMTSDELGSSSVAVLRARMKNDQLAEIAEAEGWSPPWFIGVCDGCGAFGGNHRCENALNDPSTSIPVRLGVRYWVTDHLPASDAETTRSGGRDNLVNGQIVSSREPGVDIRLRQVAFLSTDWRSRVADAIRLYGGARIFEHLPSNSDASTKALSASSGGFDVGDDR